MPSPGDGVRNPREDTMTEDDLQLPALADALLDAATVDALFFDIASVADVLSVQVKGSAEAHAAEGPCSLESARDAFVARRVLGVQVRYLHDGEEWCDTILAVGDAARLVRLRVADVRVDENQLSTVSSPLPSRS
jgi:hypothetical protein